MWRCRRDRSEWARLGKRSRAWWERLGGERAPYEWETPQHEVDLPAYYVARYPVTQAQYGAFVRDTGHSPPAVFLPVFDRPYEWQEGHPPVHLLNHPVVLVTWYDAMAYCEWLTGQLREWEGTPEPLASLLRERGWRARLPGEAEWEKAARRGLPPPQPSPPQPACTMDRRGGDRHSDGAGGANIYPWGDDPDPERANYDETGIGATSAVGCFPGGESPYGALDLCGNVWEWTRSLWGTDHRKPDYIYPYDPEDGREEESAGREVLRVLRGGSFYNSADAVRCGRRGRNYPWFWFNFIGFRLVVSPG